MAKSPLNKVLRAGVLALALIGGAAVATPVFAQSLQELKGRQINLGKGRSVFVDLPRDAAEVFVGDPKVANAVIRSARKLFIVGTGFGQTSISAVDRDGRDIMTLEINIGRDAATLQQMLKTALPRSDITVRVVNESIVLGGEADSNGDVATALDMAKAFGKSAQNAGMDAAVVNAMRMRTGDQVMVKVTIAEVQRTILKQLGVSTSTETLLNSSWGTFTQQNGFSVNGPLSNGAFTVPLSSTTQATLKAFERYGVSRVLAEPTVTAVSGEQAKLVVGGEIPYPASSTCTGGICTVGVSYKTYGVSLAMTPVVVSEGRILLRLNTEVTELDPTQSVTISGVAVPGLRTRKNETSIELPSGGSLATAGLITNNSRQGINGMPGLMNLPVLGTLFRSRDYQRQETELMIVVTPYIARATSPGEVKRPDDGFADASDPQAWLLGRVNRLYATKSNPQARENWKGRFGFIQD